LICYSFFMVGRRQENSYAHDACMCVWENNNAHDVIVCGWENNMILHACVMFSCASQCFLWSSLATCCETFDKC
jgi:hypothetical protein